MYCTLNGYIQGADCEGCKYGKISCIFRHDRYGDAERLVLISDQRREAYIRAMEIRKEKTKLGTAQPTTSKDPTWKTADQLKREALERKYNAHSGSSGDNDFMLMLGGVAVSAIIAFPVAYLFPILTILTDLLFGIITVFLGAGDSFGGLATPYKESFFYSEYWSRYFYCWLLMSTVWVWCEGVSENKLLVALQIIVTVPFAIVALLNFNLLIGTIFGPLMILFGLLFTGKRR